MCVCDVLDCCGMRVREEGCVGVGVLEYLWHFSLSVKVSAYCHDFSTFRFTDGH